MSIYTIACPKHTFSWDTKHHWSIRVYVLWMMWIFLRIFFKFIIFSTQTKMLHPVHPRNFHLCYILEVLSLVKKININVWEHLTWVFLLYSEQLKLEIPNSSLTTKNVTQSQACCAVHHTHFVGKLDMQRLYNEAPTSLLISFP